MAVAKQRPRTATHQRNQTMSETREVAEVLAKEYKAKLAETGAFPSVTGLHRFIVERMSHESYNVMDQVEAHATNIIWPKEGTKP